VLLLGLALGALMFLPLGGAGGVGFAFGRQLGIGVALFVGMLVFAALGAAIAHGTLALLGGATAPLSRSIGCSFFAHGATSLVGLIPCVNCIPFLTAIWWFSSFRLMLAGVHGCGRGKATLAALVPLLLMIAVSIGAFVVPFMLAAGVTPGTFARAQCVALSMMHRQNLAEVVRRFQLEAGRPYETPLEMLIGQPEVSLSLANVVLPDQPDAAAIGGRTIFPGLAIVEEARVAHEALRARLPAGPYRLGNLVLVPRGHPLEGQFGVRHPVGGDLWITVGSGVTETFGFPPGIDFDALPDLLDPVPTP